MEKTVRVTYAMGSSDVIPLAEAIAQGFVERPNPVWGGTCFVQKSWCVSCDFFDPERRDLDQCHKNGQYAKYCGDSFKKRRREEGGVSIDNEKTIAEKLGLEPSSHSRYGLSEGSWSKILSDVSEKKVFLSDKEKKILVEAFYASTFRDDWGGFNELQKLLE